MERKLRELELVIRQEKKNLALYQKIIEETKEAIAETEKKLERLYQKYLPLRDSILEIVSLFRFPYDVLTFRKRFPYLVETVQREFGGFVGLSNNLAGNPSFAYRWNNDVVTWQLDRGLDTICILRDSRESHLVEEEERMALIQTIQFFRNVNIEGTIEDEQIQKSVLPSYLLPAALWLFFNTSLFHSEFDHWNSEKKLGNQEPAPLDTRGTSETISTAHTSSSSESEETDSEYYEVTPNPNPNPHPTQ
jgi:hypothetical protein